MNTATTSTIATPEDTAISTKFSIEEARIREANKKQLERFMKRIDEIIAQPRVEPIRDMLQAPVENFINKLRQRHDTGRGVTAYEKQKIRDFINTAVEYSSILHSWGFCFKATNEADILMTLDYNDSAIDKKIKRDIILNDSTNEFLVDEINNSKLSQNIKKEFMSRITDKVIVKEDKKKILEFLEISNRHAYSSKDKIGYVKYILKYINGERLILGFYDWYGRKGMAALIK